MRNNNMCNDFSQQLLFQTTPKVSYVRPARRSKPLGGDALTPYTSESPILGEQQILSDHPEGQNVLQTKFCLLHFGRPKPWEGAPKAYIARRTSFCIGPPRCTSFYHKVQKVQILRLDPREHVKAGCLLH